MKIMNGKVIFEEHLDNYWRMILEKGEPHGKQG
jgi:hypothetical protein